MTHDSGGPGAQGPGTVVTFYSFKGGTGRTMAMANVAWILATNGKRVLVMDWDLEAPGLHRYFAPFLRDPELSSTPGVIDLVREFERMSPHLTDGLRTYARVDRHAHSLECSFPGGGFIEFVSSGRRTPEYSENVNTYDWRGFYENRNGKAFLHALREDMQAGYDYALIDSRTGFSDTSGITTLLLPDVLVNCFTFNVQSVDGGANVARDVRRFAPHVTILPVPMRVDPAEQDRLDTARQHARSRFQEFLDESAHPDPDRYWGDIEIPYRPYYAYEEVLATLKDPIRNQGTLLAAYERLTSVITRGEVTAIGHMAEEQRASLVKRFDRVPVAGAATPRVRIDHALRDRLWAEWIADQLKAAGVAVTLRPSSATALAPVPATAADTVLALLSPDFVNTNVAEELVTLVEAADRRGDGPRILGLRTREFQTPTALASLPGFSLVGMTAATALERVTALIGVPALNEPVAGRTRYPGEAPSTFKAPPRYNLFTGRDQELDKFWDDLGQDSLDDVHTPADRLFLYGLGGMGKTQIALEYVHRFGAQYDLVHWIPAEQTDLIPQSLANLGVQLGVQGETAEDLAMATLAELESGRRGKWLLVYDNAANDEETRQSGRRLEDYLPSNGPGHVIITARESDSGPATVEVGVFRRAESVALLRRRVENLTRQDADRIAEELGDLPMAVELAAAWLRETGMPVDTYLEQVRSRVGEVLSAGPAGEFERQTQLPAVWRLSVERLRAERPAAVRLLELCSFFSPEPIADSLLYSDGMRNELAQSDSALRDPMIMGYLIRDLSRYALARLEGRSLQVHRLLQALVREWMAVDPDALARTRSQAHLVLASALPSPSQGEDHPASLQRFAELRPHLEPSGAIESVDPQVGEWVVSQVRNLWLVKDHLAAIGLGRRALDAWTANRGADDPLTLRLAAQLANPLRSMGRYAEAFELDSDTLRRQREHPALGLAHPHTLITARNVGADLNGLGRYAEACESDADTLDRYRRSVGNDHPDTLRAINNYGVSLNLIGRPREALALAEEAYQTARQVLGVRSPACSRYALGAALDRREMGDYQGSLELLLETRQHYVALSGEHSPEVMRTDASLSVTRRRLGEFRAAEALSRTTYDQYRRRYGERHPETLACAANLSCDLLALAGTQSDPSFDEGREIAERNHANYHTTLGAEHPFTLAAATNLIIARRLGGEPLAALDLGRPTLAALERRVSGGHPAAVACRADVAGVLAQLERHDEAVAEDERAHREFLSLFGDRHPRVLCGEYNLAVDRMRVGDPGAEDRVREITRRSAARFGDTHPTTVAMREQRRIDFELEMPPI
ncbi:FxSxx-COOH system tetratricopeptide repeat protein [Streptomyces sp. PA03-6a]|nr:FxSxx-COOH system tetratricopeptide repeat protein [Streptomyces sp. PA03-6a]